MVMVQDLSNPDCQLARSDRLFALEKARMQSIKISGAHSNASHFEE
jgi:hypothetical protein